MFGGPAVAHIKYARLYNFEKKKSNFFPRRDSKNVSPGPAVALDGPECNVHTMFNSRRATSADNLEMRTVCLFGVWSAIETTKTLPTLQTHRRERVKHNQEALCVHELKLIHA